MSRDEEPPLWDYAEVMAYTGYSRRFLQEHVAAKKLKWTGSPGAKRFRKADVNAWLDAMAGIDGDSEETTPKQRRRKARPYKPVHI